MARRVRDGCNPKDIANGNEMGLFFMHCEVRLSVQKVKQIVTENFTKKCRSSFRMVLL